MRRKKLLLTTMLAVVALIAGAATATADSITSDGDVLTSSPNIGITDCSTAHTYNGTSVISYQGGSHFNSGASVTVSSAPADASSGITTGGGGAANLPNPWNSASADQTRTISVTVPAGIATGTYKINVTATGAKSGGGTLTITDFYNVNVTCPTDTTAPTVTPHVSGTAGDNGWYVSNVDVTWTVSDSESTVTSQSPACTTTTSITSDTTGQTVTCSATSAGGTTVGSVTIKRDATSPTIDCADPDGSWHAADVTLACTASDTTSGLADAGDGSFNLSTSLASGTETANASTGSHTVKDAAGNSATAGPISGNMVDKKAPVVVCDPAGTDWSQADQSVSCTATDDGSGLADSGDASFSLHTSVSSGTEDSNATTNSHDVFDAVGNKSTAGPISGNMVDKKAPVVSCGSADGAWHNADVTINCSSTDGGSGLASSSDSSFGLSTNVAADTETNNASTDSHDVLDQVGNKTTAGPIAGNKVDKKAPTVSCGTADGQWHSGNVTITCSSSDGGSGLATSSDSSFGLSTNVAAGTETDDASTGTYDVYDAVTNVTTAGPVGGNKIDRKAPTGITFTNSISNGGVYPFGTVPGAPTCGATDGGSGLDDCVVTGYSTVVGEHTLTATATDNVGNQSTSTLTYTVQAWNLVGFSAPVDNWSTPGNPATRVFNTVKGGSTVPLKFEVFAGSVELTNVSAVTSFTATSIPCVQGGVEDAVEFTSTGGTVLRYDTTGGIFIQNWQTPRAPGKCIDVTLTTADGSTLTASFKLK